MHVLVTYDVSTETPAGRRRLRKVARACQDVGQRVQKSVFECSVTEAQLEQLVRRLLKCIDEQEDSLRVYRLMEPVDRYVQQYGTTRSIDFDGPLVL